MDRHADRAAAIVHRTRGQGAGRARAGALQRLVRAVPALGRAEPAAPRHLRDVERAARRTSPAMGFDVLYLPPIHPIGAHIPQGPQQHGRRRRRRPRQPVGDRRGRGRPQGRSTRELGTLDDFRRLVAAAARARASRSRSTSPSSARPTTRGSREHPEWFQHRPDGTHPVRREPAEEVPGHLPARLRDATTGAGLWKELRERLPFWIEQGVRDLPRRQPAHQAVRRSGSGCIAEVKREHPDVIFLAEAFTRPKVMYRLAKLGFTQSYTYFTWRNTQAELTEYFTELTHAAGRASTSGPTSGRTRPTSCTEYLQHGGRAGVHARGSCWPPRSAPNYGIYGPAFELVRARAARAGHARSTSTRRSTSCAPGTSTRPDSLRDADRARQPRPPRATRRCSATAACASIRPTTTSCSPTRKHGADRQRRRARRRQPRPAPARRPAWSTLDRRGARHRAATSPTRSHDLLERRALHLARGAQLRRARSRRACRPTSSAAPPCAASTTSSTADDQRSTATAARSRPRRRRPALVQGRDHLRAARPRVPRQRRRRHRRLPRPDPEARLPRRTSASPPSGCCRSTPRRCSDDGYDIADYTDVNPHYGTLDDFQRFLDEAHRRGLRVITELVLNHTSDQHPWFQRARRAPARQRRARLLRLERHAREVPGRAHHLQGLRDVQLDLGPGRQGLLLAPLLLATSPTSTSTTPRSARPCFKVLDFWLDMGVDGLRLDAVPYLYEREGTNCENLPETHAFLQAAARARRRASSPTGCCWPRPTSGPRTPSPTSATATSATWRSTSRSCRGCSWPCSMEDRFPIIDILAADAGHPRQLPVGACSCATTTS